MWAVQMVWGSRSIRITPYMTEDDAFVILNTLDKYTDQDVHYALEEKT